MKKKARDVGANGAHPLKQAYEELKKAHQEVKEAHMAIVLKLGMIAEYRDSDTGTHLMRISDYGCQIAKAFGLAEHEIEVYRFASPMHDIGKMAIPDEILKKKDRLTVDEFEIMKQHTVIGAKMFSGSSSPILQAAEEICLSHHERWDGLGYPYGLKGEHIPLFGRILAVVDVFDALTTKRCYKEPWSFTDALAYIKKDAGKHFDPRVVNHFIRVLPKIKAFYDANQVIRLAVDASF